jgi:hypothetical protein
MPIAIVLALLIILLGFLAPVSEQTVRITKQSYLDQAVTENNEFADNAAVNFRQFKINTALGEVQRDASSHATNFQGLQLVQYRLYQTPSYVTALTNYSTWPVPATQMQTFLNEGLGSIPNFLNREEPVFQGNLTVQRWSIRIDNLRFTEWTLVDQSWLDAKFGAAGAGYSRWVAKVDIETTETFWRDQVGLDGRPFDQVGSTPCNKCTNPSFPTRGVSRAATAFKRSFEIPVCFGIPGVASPRPCNNPAFTYTSPLGVVGNACSPPICTNHVVSGENGCGLGFAYSFQLVQQP